MRTLVVHDLIDYKENYYLLTEEQNKKHKSILESIIKKEQSNHYEQLFAKAVNKSQFFFDHINELEYELYSRYNYSITFEVGKEIAKHINFKNQRVVELGGNSGGFGSAILSMNEGCEYTVFDTKIPCMVGNEFNEINHTDITFVEGDIFKLKLQHSVYDNIIMMNLLHDFDDKSCSQVISNCSNYCGQNTKFIIIEDILKNEFEPREAIIHGLRLSIECRGGKQRTIEEFKQLFLNINYKLESITQLSDAYIMLIFDRM